MSSSLQLYQVFVVDRIPQTAQVFVWAHDPQEAGSLAVWCAADWQGGDWSVSSRQDAILEVNLSAPRVISISLLE